MAICAALQDSFARLERPESFPSLAWAGWKDLAIQLGISNVNEVAVIILRHSVEACRKYNDPDSYDANVIQGLLKDRQDRLQALDAFIRAEQQVSASILLFRGPCSYCLEALDSSMLVGLDPNSPCVSSQIRKCKQRTMPLTHNVLLRL